MHIIKKHTFKAYCSRLYNQRIQHYKEKWKRFVRVYFMHRIRTSNPKEANHIDL